ncbi:MAG TPA: hypothetical protein VHO29_09280 [Marmoricola sp.]|nr:hypothetical protein [Marmoricola sp.]
MVSLVALRVLRRRTSPPAGGVVPAIGMTAFAGAGMLLLAGGIGNSATPVEWGRGLCFSDAAAALVAAAAFAVLFVRRVHTA